MIAEVKLRGWGARGNGNAEWAPSVRARDQPGAGVRVLLRIQVWRDSVRHRESVGTGALAEFPAFES
jgi:hypothetical protein